MRKDILVKDIDKMPLGDCIAVIKNKYTNTLRYANCSICRLKSGTRVAYVIYSYDENIVGYLPVK